MGKTYRDRSSTKNTSPESLVSAYVGKNLEKIGTRLPEKSSYNYNFYKLPNGTTVLLQNDDEGFNQVAVEMTNGTLKWVGAQYDGGEFMLGSFW